MLKLDAILDAKRIHKKIRSASFIFVQKHPFLGVFLLKITVWILTLKKVAIYVKIFRRIFYRSVLR